MSNVSIKLLREGAKLPTRGSAFAAGYDLYACLDGDKELIIPPHATAMLPTGLSFALPEGTVRRSCRQKRLSFQQGLRPQTASASSTATTAANASSPCTTTATKSAPCATATASPSSCCCRFCRWNLSRSTTLPETVRGEGGFGRHRGADSEHERPVHREHLTRDERRLVRREIRDRRGDVLGLAEAAERRLLGKVLEAFPRPVP